MKTYSFSGLRFRNENEMVDFMKDNPYAVSCDENSDFRAALCKSVSDGNYYLQVFSNKTGNGLVVTIGKRLTDNRRRDIVTFMDLLSSSDFKFFPKYKGIPS